MREMLTHPENVIDPFVLEKGNKFLHPFSYGLISVIIIISLYSLVLGYRTPMLADLMSKDVGQYHQLTYWIEYARLKVSTFLLPLSMLLLLTPSLSIAGLLFFRERIEGLYYNLILSTYAVGTAVLALIILVPIWFILPSALFDSTITTYLPLALTGIVILRVYLRYFLIEGGRSWIQILSNYFLGIVIFILLENFTASVIGYFIFAVERFVEIWMNI